MPEIARFYGIKVSMNYDDHNPPHIHVYYGEYEGSLSLLDFSLMNGKLPTRVVDLVKEWAAPYKEQLLEMWNSQSITHLPPLI